ncbi:MAG: sugar phosphate isomerase/epimerase [Candidatus Eisenbacteria bacterium]|nr:sugar phosphate isomerase/epimerase [Candidatus Eisenbacteria bacterium]
MKYGASTLMKGRVEEFFDAARSSFEVVEVVCDSPYKSPLDVNADFLNSVSASLGTQFTVHCPFVNSDIGSLDDAVRERSVRGVLDSIELGSAIKASLVVVHPARGTRGGLEERDRVRAVERESLVRINERAREKGLRVCVENMPSGGPFAERSLASGVMHLVKRLDGAGVTLDVGHANTTTVSAQTMARHFGSAIGHVHVHDNMGAQDEHLEIGSGTVDWRAVVKALVELKYEGAVVDESLTVAEARRGVAYLRRLAEEEQALGEKG